MRFALSLIALAAIAAAVVVFYPRAGGPPPETGAVAGEVFHYHCGETPAALAVQGDRATLALDAERYNLVQTIAASGVRYATAADDAAIVFWTKGDTARLEDQVRMRDLSCTLASPSEKAVSVPYKAFGHEPNWMDTHDGAEITLMTPLGSATVPAPKAIPHESGYHYDMEAVPSEAARKIRLTVVYADCFDTMTGLYYPEQAVLQAGDMVYRGCGAPVTAAKASTSSAGLSSPFAGKAAWKATRLAGEDLESAVDISLQVGEDGRASGRSACNRYTGPVTVDAATRQFKVNGPMAGTRMACPSGLMEIERKYLSLLETVARYDLGATGDELLFLDAEGGELVRFVPVAVSE